MNQHEFEYWQKVTAGSAHRWTEDAITRLNGKGALYYKGGENGIYMRISPDGKLTAGAYRGAYPHIGEAIFSPKAQHQYADFNTAFEAACKIGGKQFLADMFSQDMVPQTHTPDDETEMAFEMKM